ncbi:hypothetical protein K440DRAFT_633968 [Wilcoxina mikolae CBS 423.85]|nr:hypothetical protein K440DRAFT_633968 [Wilcoxina mikolae CBS 423.85]
MCGWLALLLPPSFSSCRVASPHLELIASRQPRPSLLIPISYTSGRPQMRSTSDRR